MKKLIHAVAYLLVILSVIPAILGCKTTGAAIKNEGDDYKVVDWNGKDVGAPIPKWAELISDKAKVAALPEFKDKHVVIQSESGKGLVGLKVWAETGVSSQIALQVKRGIDTALGNALQGAKDDPEKEKTVKKSTAVFAQLAISGFQEYVTFWTKIRFASGDLEYRYYVIYVIDKSIFNDQIDTILGKVDAKDAKEKENLKTIGDRLKGAADAFFK